MSPLQPVVLDDANAEQSEAGIPYANNLNFRAEDEPPSPQVDDPEWKVAVERNEKAKSNSSCNSFADGPQPTVVEFSDGDSENPKNWPASKKFYVGFVSILLVVNSTMGSALPSGITSELQTYFHITNKELLVFPVAMYLMGYVLGPLAFAPLSETFGRWILLASTFFIFTVFSLGSALAPTFAGLVVFRLLVGVGASTPISVIGGIFADIYADPRARGRAIMIFMAATILGALIAPTISGFVGVVSWRWAFWIELIVAGATWPLLLMMPETNGDVILCRRAKRLRKETGNQSIKAPMELNPRTNRDFVKEILGRPFQMLFKEPIVFSSCIYLAFVYAIFYLYFESYPTVFEDIYHFNAGEEGLAFLPIGVGCLIAGVIFLVWEKYYDSRRAKENPPSWALKEEYARLPVACVGSPLFAISLFWLGWTARPSIHWICPMLSGILFGIGFLTNFIALVNYIVDAYDIYAASALAVASCSRSLLAVAMPFAATPLYTNLGVNWGSSLIGFIAIILGVIPYVFIIYGPRIRERSQLCQEISRKKEEEKHKKPEYKTTTAKNKEEL